MTMTTPIESSQASDRQLVQRHLAGEPAAFRQIVERYQGMVCALAVSGCGDVARSEDLAQEVFVTAWRGLPKLGDPGKLRAWLGGITRNLILRSFRQARSTPTHAAEPLSPEIPDGSSDPSTQAVSADEVALLWSVVMGIPQVYREPLILFYREHQSVAAVAATLELSEEAVRQRLLRGRAMLSERIANRVESALERSAPQASFVGAVLLALPHPAIPTLAAGSMGGGAMVKGGIGVKLLTAFAALPALVTGLTDYLRFRAELESTGPADRSRVIRRHVIPLMGNAFAAVLIGLLIGLGAAGGGNGVGFGIGVACLVAGMAVYQRRKGCPQVGAAGFEYRSRGGFMGMPWVHVRAGGAPGWAVARGWIAISDGVAIGGCFAGAPLAIAPLSVGNVAVGGFVLGGIVAGIGALGGVALGWWAAGGVALAGKAAWGALAMAPDFAVGNLALATHANNSAARAYLAGHEFFILARSAWRIALWGMFTAWIPALGLISWRLWRSRGASSAAR